MYLGHNSDAKPSHMSPNDLLTHGVILGRTGSGKTGLTATIIEEAAYAGASVVVLDPKGDLTNLGLSLIDKEEFAAWSETPESTRLDHGEGLAAFDLGFDNVKHWRESIDVKIFTPGDHSRPVNLFSSFSRPADLLLARDKALREVASVLQVVSKISDPSNPAVIYLAEAVLHAWDSGDGLPIGDWPGVLNTPIAALSDFGGMPVDDFFPENQRKKLARSLIGFLAHSARWLTGEEINLKHMAEIAQRPQIHVYTLKHLKEEERQFFATLFMHRVVDYMYETGASNHLKLLVVMDEARGYLPPHPHNPGTKAPITTVLAQGRAQGIGMLLGTQNPMDIDYKALSNVGTWFVGRLRERDCARDLANELENRGVDLKTVMNIPQRQFLLMDKHGGNDTLKVRWCMNHLHGPIACKDLDLLEKPDWADTTRPFSVI